MFRRLFSFIILSFLKLRYRLKVEGLKDLNLDPNRGVIFLPNHPAYIDPIIVLSLLGKKHRPGVLIDEDQLDRPLMMFIQKMIPMFPIPNIVKVRTHGKRAIDKTVDKLIDELNRGNELLLYPSGRIYRQGKEVLHGTSSVYKIMQGADKPQVVLVRTRGLWGSALSWGGAGRQPALGWRELFHFLVTILLNGIFFVPKRDVSVEFVKQDDFPYDASKKEINKFLDNFYNATHEELKLVPYYFFKKRLIFRNRLQRKSYDDRPELDIVTSSTRQSIYDYLTREFGSEEFEDDMSLSIDLGMDSLAKAEMIQWIDREFGVSEANTDQIITVGDALLYASNELALDDDEDMERDEAIHIDWFNGNWKDRVKYSPKTNLLEMLVHQAKKNPKKKIVADRLAGVKSYRDFLTGMFVIRKFIREMEGENVGFMLPATVTSAMAYFSIIAAGKTPVMLNWTVGKRNLEHAINSLGIKNIITSEQLIDRLSEQGIDVDSIKDYFFPLERLKTEVKTKTKIKALLKAVFYPDRMLSEKVTDTAAIIFTSGSESLPKSVPLSHSNIIANLDGTMACIPMYSKDRLMGFLPPFHSFGLAVHVILPLVCSVPVVYHANPMQPKMIAKIIEKYRATILVGTPTFLNGILKRSAGLDLSCLRVAVVGAEKCPTSVFDLAQKTCSGIEIMEGYGITECSPIIAANPYGKIKLGTVGKVLHNVEYVLVDPEDNTKLKNDGETPSMLLVRGPSIFSGYLNYDGASPFIDVDGKTYYKTGDLVIEDSDGYLTFSGRLKRFVKIGGEMVSLPAIETELLKHFKREDGLAPLAIEAREADGRPEIVLFTTMNITREEANAILRDAGFSGLSNIRELVEIDEIPLLGTGKTDYRSLKDSL